MCAGLAATAACVQASRSAAAVRGRRGGSVRVSRRRIGWPPAGTRLRVRNQYPQARIGWRAATALRTGGNSPRRRTSRISSGEFIRSRCGLGGPGVCGLPRACASATSTLSRGSVGGLPQRSALAATVRAGGLCAFPAANSFAPAGGRHVTGSESQRASFAPGADPAARACAASQATARPQSSDHLPDQGMNGDSRQTRDVGSSRGILPIFLPFRHVRGMSPIWRTSRT
jgi:hypothetical protein